MSDKQKPEKTVYVLTRRQKAEIKLQREISKQDGKEVSRRSDSEEGSESKNEMLEWIRQKQKIKKKEYMEEEKDLEYSTQMLKKQMKDFKKKYAKQFLSMRGKSILKNKKAKAIPRFDMYPSVLNELNFLQFKYERIKIVWNGNMKRLRRFVRNWQPLPHYDNFIRRVPRMVGVPFTEFVRLSLNRYDFLLQNILMDFTDKKMLFSMLDNYLIFHMVIRFKQRQEPVFCKYNLMSSYLRRSSGTIMSQVMRMRKNMHFRDIEFLCNDLVGGFLWGKSNGLRLVKHGEEVEMFNERRISVIRFSFLVDLFLLSLFKKYQFDEFVDHPRLICKIEEALREKRPLDFMKNERKKYSGWGKDKSPENFILNYDEMINNEKVFLKVIIRLEAHIKKLQFDKKLKLYQNSDKLEESVKRYRRFLSRKNVREDGEEDSQSQSGDQEEESSQSIQKSSASRVSRSELLTKREDMQRSPEKESEEEMRNSPHKSLIEVEKKKTTKPTQLVKSKMNLSLKERRPIYSMPFYDFGVGYLKKNYQFQCLEVEDLSREEKKALFRLLTHLKKFPEKTKLADVLRLLFHKASSNMKEYLRNLDIILSLLKKNRLHIKDSFFRMQILHILVKMEQMIQLLKSRLYGQFREPRVRASESSSGQWFVDFLIR